MQELQRPGSLVTAVTTATCSNCRAMKPLVDATSEEFGGKVALVHVDAAAEPGKAAELGIRGVPTYIAQHDGDEVMRRTGRMDRGELEALFAAAHSGAASSARMGATDRTLRLGAALVFAAAAAITATPALGALAVAAAAFGTWDLVARR